MLYIDEERPDTVPNRIRPAGLPWKYWSLWKAHNILYKSRQSHNDLPRWQQRLAAITNHTRAREEVSILPLKIFYGARRIN